MDFMAGEKVLLWDTDLGLGDFLPELEYSLFGGWRKESWMEPLCFDAFDPTVAFRFVVDTDLEVFSGRYTSKPARSITLRALTLVVNGGNAE